MPVRSKWWIDVGWVRRDRHRCGCCVLTGVPQELTRASTFECFDGFVREFNARCDGLVAQVERQAHDRQIIDELSVVLA